MNSTHDRAPFFFGQPFAHTHTPFFLPYIFALLPPVPPQVSFLRSKKRGGGNTSSRSNVFGLCSILVPFLNPNFERYQAVTEKGRCGARSGERNLRRHRAGFVALLPQRATSLPPRSPLRLFPPFALFLILSHEKTSCPPPPHPPMLTDNTNHNNTCQPERERETAERKLKRARDIKNYHLQPGSGGSPETALSAPLPPSCAFATDGRRLNFV